jgi:RyR domain
MDLVADGGARMAGSATRVVVDGDVTVDWSLARGQWAGQAIGHGGVAVSHQVGGAALLADLVAQVASLSGDGADVVGPTLPATVGPGDPGFHHSWAQWSQSAGGGGGWWLERNLGITPTAGDGPARRLEPDVASLVVLDDAGLGFRDRPDRWPAVVASQVPGPWVLVKMSAPLAGGALWDHLFRWHRERLVVVVRVEDLRASQAQISRGLSWERTAQDLVWELMYNRDISALSRCAHVVVSFGAAGAVLASRQAPSAVTGDHPAFWLVFDPKVMEGEWEHERPGGVIGGTTTLTAFLAHALTGDPDPGQLCMAVAEGLTATRNLHEGGYESDTHGRLRYPVARVAEAGSKPDGLFDRVAVRDPGGASSVPGPSARGGSWTILEQTYPEALDHVARQVVVEGPGAVLRGVPHGRFGNLLTVDRHEIEALRAIRALMEQYCGLDQVTSPLSIAVFGPPGSGKSFGVTEVAKSLLPGRITKLEFNLSQLGSPDDMIDALHQVRDTALSGEVPLVFWDEFDTPLRGQPLGWLRYFLAPMQDGKFRQGQIVHPIGRAVFVFAGGTASSISEFGRDLSEEQQRAAKQPDFVSRLRGYLDVLGPNPRPADGEPGADRFYQLRRAILLQSLLRRKAPRLIHGAERRGTLSLDPGVLHAFLEVPRYRHGARSMEAIIDMSQLGGYDSFQRSCLPSQAQLDLHVDGRHFLALVQRLDLSGELLEQLAAAAHVVFCEDLIRRGYRPGPVHDEDRKISPKLLPYDELSEQDKEQNRATVRDIPDKLARAGYIMAPARSEEAGVGFPADVLEQLARDEHDRWMSAKVAAGWSYGTPTDEEAKRHEAILSWAELPEGQKDKDRAVVTGIPALLGRCGYAVVPVPA